MEIEEKGSFIPFVKNRYYPGKLLHASDFIREQVYGNSKLEFLNRKFHGCGIIEGMDVIARDRGNLYLTPGSAIDARGRILIVPEEIRIAAGDLAGASEAAMGRFILGIRYAERTVERERSLLEEQEVYEAARIEESFVLEAHSPQEWEQLQVSGGREDALTQEYVLYEDEEMRLSLLAPRVVPSDSMFKIRIQARLLRGSGTRFGWCGMVRLQGAFFLKTGKSVQVVKGKQTFLAGSLCQEWELCTEERRKGMVTLELSHMEVLTDRSGSAEVEGCQVCIETAEAYEAALRRYLQAGEERETECEADWLPLAWIRRIANPAKEGRAFEVLGDCGLRLQTVYPWEREVFRKNAEESGIVDIRWRRLLKYSLFPVSKGSQPPARKPPEVQASAGLKEKIVPAVPEEEQTSAALKGQWQINRGVVVLPIPRRCRKGTTLLSEEIYHGFSGEEVLIWCGRMYEEPNYAYWERDKTKYTVIHGAEELFTEGWDSGWEIRSQATRQNVAEGTFQIALTLSKGRRRKRCREVAVSWIAVRIT